MIHSGHITVTQLCLNNPIAGARMVALQPGECESFFLQENYHVELET